MVFFTFAARSRFFRKLNSSEPAAPAAPSKPLLQEDSYDSLMRRHETIEAFRR
jgi:hypothetical protein